MVNTRPRHTAFGPSATPTRMPSRFTSTCRACGATIEVGEIILWSRASGARHELCPQVEQAPEPKRIAVEDQGVYVMPDGTVVKVQANRSKTRTYAKRWVEIGGTRITEAGTFVNGEYEFVPGLVEQVAEQGRKMGAAEAEAFIIRYGRCVRCGRALKDADSVAAAMGPVCRGYFGLTTSAA